jgi:hypothetical protein
MLEVAVSPGSGQPAALAQDHAALVAVVRREHVRAGRTVKPTRRRTIIVAASPPEYAVAPVKRNRGPITAPDLPPPEL